MNGLLRWFSHNHVAANLLMLVIVISGLMAALSIKQEIFPEFDTDLISIRVPYLGASPSEVEEGVCIKIEEEIQSIDGIKEITSSAAEGVGIVIAELDMDADGQELLDEIKSAVDRIVTFPEETEKPVITRIEPRRQVIDVVVYGDVAERTLKMLAEHVRDDLNALPEITYTEVVGTRPFEISIEISEADLQRYGLSIEQVTRAVRLNSLDLPGGSVKTTGGEILVRTKGQKYTGSQFADITVITKPDGSKVTLGQIATIHDAFEDVDVRSSFDGRPAAAVAVYRVGDEGVLDVADAVKNYVAMQRPALPSGIEIATWYDRSLIYRGRMNLLLKNGAFGLILVFGCLTLFLQFRLAFWVALGIVISFLGAFWVLPMLGVSLNMISLFAFILSLGLVVDDAIVAGENIYAHREMGKKARQASTDGIIEVSAPVIFAVLTTVVAFVPLLRVEGIMGKFLYNIPIVVIAVLMFSLVEALLVLPAHLSTIRRIEMAPESSGAAAGSGRGLGGFIRRHKGMFAGRMRDFVENVYKKHLDWSLRHRAVVVSLAAAGLLLTLGLIAGGRVKFTLMPRVDADNIVVSLTMPQGTTVENTEAAVKRIEAALNELQSEVETGRPENAPPILQHVFTSVGSQKEAGGHFAISTATGGHLAEIVVQLLSAEERGMSSQSLAERWRELTGPIAGASALSFSADLFRGGKAIQVQLSSPDDEALAALSERLKLELANYPGVTDISDSFEEGKLEMKLTLKPEARTLGLTLNDLAHQVRQGFYGDEAMRIQRGRDEIKVMVRYPEAERRSLGNIESMRIRTPAGAEVPFYRVAEATVGRGYATIDRADRQRIVNVFADVNQSQVNAQEVLADLNRHILPNLLLEFPGARYDFEGQERDRADSFASLGRGFLLAIFMIYALLAVLFRSYAQPGVVMLAIPFGLMGATWGHIVMGWNLTMLSLFGAVALTGVVVNDSLIMIDFINRARRSGRPMREAVLESGARRFRPIILTSVTTFAGLTPLLLEKSMQARFLIPMAISLGFGVVFATAITLLLVPTTYTLLEDFKRWLGMSNQEETAAEPVRSD